MNHKLRVEHRTVEGILSSLAGGLLVASLIQKSLWMGTAALLVGIVLLVIERRDMESEESVPSPGPSFTLSSEVLSVLRKTAAKKFSDNAQTYSDGLSDGSAITAQFVLGEMEEESE